MTFQTMEREALDAFLDGLIARQRVVGVKRKENQFVFGDLSSAREMEWDSTPTIIPPKQFLFPPQETLLRFSLAGGPSVEPVLQAEPLVLAGVHPCDIHAIQLLDRIFADGNADEHYLRRRAATTIIGVECMPDDHCFCASVEAATATSGYDILVTPIGEKFAVEVATQKGQELIAEHAQSDPAESEDIAALRMRTNQKLRSFKKRLNIDYANIPMFFDGVWDSPVWKKWADKCLSCGTCNMTCPTCYCFDVLDKMELNLTDGERMRLWDGCMLKDFAVVASGENFRESRTNRLEHRFYRKFSYLFVKYGRANCVGCGRCCRQCLADITVYDVVNDLVASRREEATAGV
jgi:sulfhydrogenase subunit beta (sulfur reductase)